MYYLKTLFVLVALALPAWASIEFTSVPTAVVAGQTYTLTWATTDTGPVTIELKSGSAANLQTVGVITADGAGGSYTWTAPATLANGAYAFQISAGTDVNYSGYFTYTGGSGVSSAAVSSVATSVATSAATSGLSSLPSSGTTATGLITSIGTQTSQTTATSTTTTSKSIATLTSTKAGSTTTVPTATASSTVPTGAAVAVDVIASPIALVLGAAVAMVIV